MTRKTTPLALFFLFLLATPAPASAQVLGAACTTANQGVLGFAGNTLVCTTGNQWAVNVYNDLPNGNIAVGTGGLGSFTSGTQNTAVGTYALTANATHGGSTAVGYQAMAYYALGDLGAGATYNTAVGTYALRGPLAPGNTGISDTAVGYQALYSNTTGSGNVAVGYSALYSNTTGIYNVAVGYEALYSNTVVSGNIAIGNTALRNTVAAGNTAIGTAALQTNVGGDYNTALGDNALQANPAGTQNTAIGASALHGIGGNYNTALGYAALFTASGSNNTALGNNSGSAITTGSNNTTLGNNAQVPNGANSNQVRIGSATVTYAGVQVAWTVTSDRRIKKDIQDSDLGLAFIEKLRPVSYRLKNGNNRLDYGFVAQDVEQALDGRVTNMVTQMGDEMKTYQIRGNDLIAPLVKAVQEIVAKFDGLTKTTADLMADFTQQDKINQQLLEQIKAQQETNLKQQEVNMQQAAALAKLAAYVYANDNGDDQQPKPVPKNKGF